MTIVLTNAKKKSSLPLPQKQIINQHTDIERESKRGGLEAEAEEKVVR